MEEQGSANGLSGDRTSGDKPAELWLLQDRLNADIGTSGVRIEGDEFFHDERLAQQLYDPISSHIADTAASDFGEGDWRAEVNVSFQVWKTRFD